MVKCRHTKTILIKYVYRTCGFEKCCKCGKELREWNGIDNPDDMKRWHKELREWKIARNEDIRKSGIGRLWNIDSGSIHNL